MLTGGFECCAIPSVQNRSMGVSIYYIYGCLSVKKYLFQPGSADRADESSQMSSDIIISIKSLFSDINAWNGGGAGIRTRGKAKGRR